MTLLLSDKVTHSLTHFVEPLPSEREPASRRKALLTSGSNVHKQYVWERRSLLKQTILEEWRLETKIWSREKKRGRKKPVEPGRGRNEGVRFLGVSRGLI